MSEPIEFMEVEPEDGSEEVFDIDCDSEYKKFDLTIGHIEDIIMSEAFQRLQDDFMEKYYHEFEDNDENKFIYSDIHKNYTSIIESYLTQKLTELSPEFSMEEFQDEIKSMDLDCEIFEILLSFSDFLVFKDTILQYKKSKENNYNDLCLGVMTVKSIMSKPPPSQQPSSQPTSKATDHSPSQSNSTATKQHPTGLSEGTTSTSSKGKKTSLVTKNSNKPCNVSSGVSDSNITSLTKNKHNVKSSSAANNYQPKISNSTKNTTKFIQVNTRVNSTKRGEGQSRPAGGQVNRGYGNCGDICSGHFSEGLGHLNKVNIHSNDDEDDNSLTIDKLNLQ